MAQAKQNGEKDYDDIPGTYVFDADRSRAGLSPQHVLHVADEGGEPQGLQGGRGEVPRRSFPLTPDQREAILKRQYNRMLELGGNIYFTAKLGATDGHPFQHLAALMTGSTQQDYADLMLRGGRSVEGNRSRSGKFAKPKIEHRQSGKPKPKTASKGKKRRG